MAHIYVVLEDGRPLYAFCEKKTAYDCIASSLDSDLSAKHAYCVKAVELFRIEEDSANDHDFRDRMPYLHRFL